MFRVAMCKNNKLHGDAACGRCKKANSHHSYNIIIQRAVFVNIKEYRYMTKLGDETGENAVILMKINNGVLFGEMQGKQGSCAGAGDRLFCDGASADLLQYSTSLRCAVLTEPMA